MVKGSWSRVSGARFSGWGACTASSRGVRVRSADVGPHTLGLGRDIDVTVSHDEAWPVYTVAPTTAPARHRAVYVHGGGWVNEIDPAHWRFVAELAVASQTAVRVPIYPLVPWGTAGEVVPWVSGLVQADIDALEASTVPTKSTAPP